MPPGLKANLGIPRVVIVIIKANLGGPRVVILTICKPSYKCLKSLTWGFSRVVIT